MVEDDRAPSQSCTDTMSTRENDDADPSALPLHVARARLIDAIAPVTDVERVPLADARGRTLAAAAVSVMDVPPFRASAMDGYAFRSGDAAGVLRVARASLAGHPAPDALAAGECVRITTGARVPDDADAVVQQENVTVDGEALRFLHRPDRGRHVRDAGSDSRRGERLAEAGTPLRAATLALMAAHGVVEVDVLRRPRIALLSTGDELCDPGTALASGQVYDANRPLLTAMLADLGVETIDLGIVADTPAALARAIALAGDVDAWVSSGGVSVGDADHVRDALADEGEMVFWKIAMKPGRPLAFGRVHGRPWIGLPGNPVSAAVTTLMLVRPALIRLCGRVPRAIVGIAATLEGALDKVPGRLEFQRGVLRHDASGGWRVTTAGLQESHGLLALQRANCLIEMEAESRGAAEGTTVTVHPFEGFAESPL